MKNYLIYFVDENSDASSQASNLENQISTGNYELSETVEQRERNQKIADYFDEKIEDIHEFENPFQEEFIEETADDEEAETFYPSIEMSDSHGLKLELVASYIFINLPEVGGMWEFEIVNKKAVEIISYCQKNYNVLAFDADTIELLDEISEESET